MDFLVDLHVHSDASPCSTLGAADIIHGAKISGIDGVALVEHGALPPSETVAAIAASGVAVFPGMEISTEQGDLLIFGVMQIPPPDLDAAGKVRWVWERRGAVVLAHPYRASRPAGPELLQLAGIPFEVCNGRCSAEENLCAAETALELSVPTVAGSDAHRPGEVGRAVTIFPERLRHVADLANALRAGYCTPLPLRDKTPLSDRLAVHL